MVVCEFGSAAHFKPHKVGVRRKSLYDGRSRASLVSIYASCVCTKSGGTIEYAAGTLLVSEGIRVFIQPPTPSIKIKGLSC